MAGGCLFVGKRGGSPVGEEIFVVSVYKRSLGCCLLGEVSSCYEECGSFPSLPSPQDSLSLSGSTAKLTGVYQLGFAALCL